MRMFTKMGLTVAAGAMPVLLWAGSASAQQSQSQSPGQSQSQSQLQPPIPINPTLPTQNSSGNSGGGGLARTGNNELLPLAVGGAALAGAVVVRRGLRRRSPA